MKMAQELITTAEHNDQGETAALIMGTGLAVASMIIVPAVAMRLGLSASLTGALRIALMKASSRASRGANDDSAAGSAEYSCH